MLCQIDLGNRDAELPADLGRVPLPQDIIVKNLELLGRHFCFDAFQSRLKKVILPFPFPYLVKIILPFIRDFVDGVFQGIRGIRVHQHGRVLFPLAELVIDAPAGHVP